MNTGLTAPRAATQPMRGVMTRSLFMAALAVGAALLGVRPALAECRLGMVAELPLDPNRDVPVAEGEINGQPARFLIDTGSSWTMIVREEALKRHLAMGRLAGVTVYGVGGAREVFGGTVRSLKVGTLVATNVQVIAAGPAKGASDVAVVLGEDAMSEFDVEFDLANHFVRFFKPEGCTPDQLVYWNKPYSQAALPETDRDSPSVRMPVNLNGKRVEAVLSSGSSVSVVDTTAADAVGARIDKSAPDEVLHGVGIEPKALTVSKFASFALGDEAIGNVRIWSTAFSAQTERPDGGSFMAQSASKDPTRTLLVGADFLRAHRVLVANREHLMVFSYVGGPVFSLPTSADLSSGAAQVTNMNRLVP
jgi:predicted aspartyl protease